MFNIYRANAPVTRVSKEQHAFRESSQPQCILRLPRLEVIGPGKRTVQPRKSGNPSREENAPFSGEGRDCLVFTEGRERCPQVSLFARSFGCSPQSARFLGGGCNRCSPPTTHSDSEGGAGQAAVVRLSRFSYCF